MRKLDAECSLIWRLQEAWAEVPMHLNCAANNAIGNGMVMIHTPLRSK